jgi:hypothetical protein
MLQAIQHRGIVDGAWCHPGVGLGSRRLPIIDVAHSAQPLFNEDESLVLVGNGEIFNYRDLRERLAGRGHVFRTYGDLECILHLYEEGDESFWSDPSPLRSDRRGRPSPCRRPMPKGVHFDHIPDADQSARRNMQDHERPQYLDSDPAIESIPSSICVRVTCRGPIPCVAFGPGSALRSPAVAARRSPAPLP